MRFAENFPARREKARWQHRNNPGYGVQCGPFFPEHTMKPAILLKKTGTRQVTI
jgi:hypothetical protein